ncbi:hypothetical protein VARIO8X_90062 [Burkholderiales bacterium 8X]|nr:hypothetical protein VARIO8X_90062 [Burkholderiales bacterium 8X]
MHHGNICFRFGRAERLAGAAQASLFNATLNRRLRSELAAISDVVCQARLHASAGLTAYLGACELSEAAIMPPLERHAASPAAAK